MGIPVIRFQPKPILCLMFLRAVRSFSRVAKMSTYTTDKASPFTMAVMSSMRKLYAYTSIIAKLFGLC